MREEQRYSLCMRRSGMDEVDRLPVDRGPELVERVQSGLLGAPVVRVPPVLDQLTEVVDWDAVLPTRPVHLIRKAGPLQAMAQILEEGIFKLDVKLIDRLAHRSGPGSDSGSSRLRPDRSRRRRTASVIRRGRP